MPEKVFVNICDLYAHRILILAVSAAALVLGGCNRGPQMGQVSGKVLLNGQPLKFGTVAFQPPSGQPSIGDIQNDGTFSLSTYRPGDGAIVGHHRVRVACYESQRPGTKPTGGEQSLGKSLIPLNYTLFDQSGLTAEVKSGENEPLVIELKGPAVAQ
ncbi:MAG: hypothetical protein U0805_18020 [Pirellulales bacterium]